MTYKPASPLALSVLITLVLMAFAFRRDCKLTVNHDLYNYSESAPTS